MDDTLDNFGLSDINFPDENLEDTDLSSISSILGIKKHVSFLSTFGGFQFGGIGSGETIEGEGELIPGALSGLTTSNVDEMSQPEKLLLYRKFYRLDPFVAAAIDMHSELPLSRIKINPPEIEEDPDLAQFIMFFYENMINSIRLFPSLLQIGHHYWLDGYAVVWTEYNEDLRMWDSITVLDPLVVDVRIDPLTKKQSIFLIANNDDLLEDFRNMQREGFVAGGVVKDLESDGEFELPSDPYTNEGSFAICIGRKTSPIGDEAGISLVERNLRSLIRAEYLWAAQEAQVRRSLKNKDVWVIENGGVDQAEDFRYQLWLATFDPQYEIVTTYNVTNEKYKGDENLLDLAQEYEHNEDLMMTGFGLTKSLVQRESEYSGERISLEIINTKFFLFREMIQDLVEEYWFKPIAYKNGFFVKLKQHNPDYIRERLDKAFTEDTAISGTYIDKGDEKNGKTTTSVPEEKVVDGEMVKVPQKQAAAAKRPSLFVPKDSMSLDAKLPDPKLGKGVTIESSAGTKNIESLLTDENNALFNRQMTVIKSSRGHVKGPTQGRYGLKKDIPRFFPSNAEGDKEQEHNLAHPHKNPFILWLYPKLSFKRVSITDSDEAFNQLMNMYQRGSITLDYVLDMFNIDSSTVEAKLRKDFMTLKDPLTAEAMNSLMSSIGSNLSENKPLQKKFLERTKLFTDKELKELFAGMEEEDTGGF